MKKFYFSIFSLLRKYKLFLKMRPARSFEPNRPTTPDGMRLSLVEPEAQPGTGLEFFALGDSAVP